MMVTELVDHFIETDVLVLGGGMAGPRAAIEAKKNRSRVFLIVKGIYGSSGCSLGPSVASGIGPWSDPKDSIDQHFRDMLIKGKRFLADQELLKIQASEGGERDCLNSRNGECAGTETHKVRLACSQAASSRRRIKRSLRGTEEGRLLSVASFTYSLGHV